MEAHRERAAKSGPRPVEELETLERTVSAFDGPGVVAEWGEAALENFIRDRDLQVTAGTHEYAQLKAEHRLALRNYYQFLVEHDRSLRSGGAGREQQAIAAPEKAGTGTLRELVDQYAVHTDRENRGTQKTRNERLRHMDLLFEILGETTATESIGWTEARKVRETLAALPLHRTKLKATRDKPIAEVLAQPGGKRLHVRTINKHLVSYASMFRWAVQNGYVGLNPFKGLAFDTTNANEEDPRIPFSSGQLAAIRTALLEGNVSAHHKWGALIGMHLGARLNEISQLHLDDISCRDGIWCFDINAKDKATTRKRLKNRQSARIVPVHPALLEFGLLDYMEEMRARSGNVRLFPQLPYTVSDGYGRNLGRWFNSAFLPNLGMKTEQLSFHSLRHSMVDRLVAADVSQAHVMAIVGHEPGTTTLKVYNRNGFPAKQLLEALGKIVIG